MKNVFILVVCAVVVFYYGHYQRKKGFEEGWQAFVDLRPPNPPPTKCVLRNADWSKCIAWGCRK